VHNNEDIHGRWHSQLDVVEWFKPRVKATSDA